MKSSTSKLVKKYCVFYFISLIVYTVVWISISLAMLFNRKGTILNEFAGVFGSFSGIIINSLRICDPALWNYIKSRFQRPKRKESITRRASVYESSYIQMFSHVFNAAVLKCIISLNLVLSTESEIENKDIIWTREHYEEKQLCKYDSIAMAFPLGYLKILEIRQM